MAMPMLPNGGLISPALRSNPPQSALGTLACRKPRRRGRSVRT